MEAKAVAITKEELMDEVKNFFFQFIDDVIKVARYNLPESHVQEVARLFAAVLNEQEYADVAKEDVDAILTTEEEDEI